MHHIKLLKKLQVNIVNKPLSALTIPLSIFPRMTLTTLALPVLAFSMLALQGCAQNTQQATNTTPPQAKETAMKTSIAPTQVTIKNGFKEHAIMAQFHRWYQIYERPAGGIDNALDILSRNVIVTSGLGTANGHKEYSERVQKLPQTWQNAHHVQSADITFDDNDNASLNAKVAYQNIGMLPNGQLREAQLNYSVALEPTNTVLPLLSAITITADEDANASNNSESTPPKYHDAYANNRMLSLVHYWLALIEDPSRNPEPVKEILADDFSLNFSSGVINDFAGFKKWLAGPASQVAASTHILRDFSARKINENEYALSVDFEWFGILPNGAELVAKTRHNWTASNDVTERFARIKTVDVEVLEPFRPRQK